MRPAGPVPLTALRSTPWAAATRAATGVTLAPSGTTAGASPPGRGADVGSSAGATAALAAPGPAVIRARTWPTVTVSPASARISVRVPLAGEGISASTLSVEISTSVSSISTRSPADLAHSRIVPSDTDSPICGIVMSMVLASPASGSASASAAGSSSAVAAGALPLVGAISARTAPTSTVSPSAKLIFTTVPEAGAGTSASTLSVEISTSVSSSATVSPSCLCHSRMVPSETDSPIAGMATSTVVLTAMSRSDHTAFRQRFLPAYAVFVVDESSAAREGAEAADHDDRDGEPHGNHAPPHSVDAEQRDDDPADPVGPPEVELGGLIKNCEHEQRHVDRGVRERQVLQLPEGHGSSSLAMWRSAPSASAGQASTSCGHQACSSCSESGTTTAPGASQA